MMMTSASSNLLILGARSALGTALARLAAHRAALRIFLSSRSSDPSSLIEGADVRCMSGVNLTNEGDLQRLADAAGEFFSGPFSVVHSVGDFWIHKPFVHTGFEEICSMAASHYLTLCGAMRFLLPVLVNKGGGRIVALSCNSVLYSYPDMAPFTAAKAAVESLVKCLANEYAEYGIAFTALALPTIRTEKVLVEKPAGDHDNYLLPDEVAGIVLDHVVHLPATVSGNVLKVFKHSSSFYGLGYFQRNPRQTSILSS